MRIRNYDFYNQDRNIDDAFYNLGTLHYNVNALASFDPDRGEGLVNFKRNERKNRMSFNLINNPFEETQSWTFPPDYDDNPDCPIRFSMVSDRTARLEISFNRLQKFNVDEESVMLDGPVPSFAADVSEEDGCYVYRTEHFTAKIRQTPFALELYDAKGKLLTKTMHQSDSRSLMNYAPLPLSFGELNSNLRRSSAISMGISVGEHFYACGESFGHLNKRGQSINLWTQDPHGSEGQAMYKPVPFYFSSRGYGVFVHSGAAMTFDFGNQYNEAQTLFVDDDVMDVFFFVGEPKEVLGEYTNLTGRSSMPPLWSFGLWMSRITYNSEAQAREVAEKMQEHQIPCDVIHLDTGWFEKDWRCDYVFSETRFDDPEKMIKDLNSMGYHVSLWQLPYFTPKNPLYGELVERGYAIFDADGTLPSGDAIIDMSNPDAVAWYQEKLGNLMRMGVSAIKADFGEAAPVDGVYHSAKSGRYEHNLYPLRYNKAVYDVTKDVTGDGIIWARSAWAGSQRYPLHWAGDTENTNMGLLSAIRGCLSLGMSGFSFTSHDAGGFVRVSEEELYGRWMFASIFSSHIRCHGLPPKEPWNFSEAFTDLFRKQVNLRYQLMPYIMGQSAKSAEAGLPLQRSMYLEFSSDPNTTGLEDQYMLGEDLLIAPLFEAKQESRQVYLPVGSDWVDFFTREVYEGGKWHTIASSDLQGIALVRSGSIIPMVPVSLTTRDIDWDALYAVAYGDSEEDSILTYDPNQNSYTYLDRQQVQIR